MKSSGGGKDASLVTLPDPIPTSGWKAPIDTNKSQIPTKIVNPQNLPIDELALLEIRTLRPDRLAEPMLGMPPEGKKFVNSSIRSIRGTLLLLNSDK